MNLANFHSFAEVANQFLFDLVNLLFGCLGVVAISSAIVFVLFWILFYIFMKLVEAHQVITGQIEEPTDTDGEDEE